MYELVAPFRINDLSMVWRHEARDFTRWLSDAYNLSILGNEIGMNLKFVRTEPPLSLFSVDLFAEEERTGKKVIIQSHLQDTDYAHLGKLITYASGYNAETVIWIVKEAREDHRKAIDWLNEHADGIRFFLIEIELWKIAESPIAVKFHVISRPNVWVETIRSAPGKSVTGESWEQIGASCIFRKKNYT